MIKYDGYRVGLTADLTFGIREWRNDPEIFKWCRQTSLISKNEHMNWIENHAWSSKTKMFGIINEDGEEVGVCGLTNIDMVSRNAEFSIYIAPQFQKKGYGQEALSTLIRHGFQDFNLHKIWGESFDGNPAIKMFEKLGFRISFGHAQHYFKNGNYLSSYFSVMFKHDWDRLLAEKSKAQ